MAIVNVDPCGQGDQLPTLPTLPTLHPLFSDHAHSPT